VCVCVCVFFFGFSLTCEKEVRHGVLFCFVCAEFFALFPEVVVVGKAVVMQMFCN